MPKETVLITGANRGLGLALAEEFLSSRYRLLLHSRVGKELPSCFREAEAVVRGDLKDWETMMLLNKGLSNFPVDILVNNAGAHLSKPFSGCSRGDIDDLMRVNLLAPMILTRLFWGKLKMVVNINSLACRGGGPGEAIYAASKAGLAGFSETLQFDGTEDGVKVLNVNLGALKTDMTKGRPNWDMLVDPAEAAQVIVRLCRDCRSLRVTSVDIKRNLY